MAHVAKFSRASAPMILSHCLRHKDWNNEFVTYGNQSIDPKITPLNYRLDHNEDPQSFLKERLVQVKVQKRADVKVLCSWVVTVPKDLPHNKHREFFDSVYSFICKDVGEENVVLASVHVDETTPHMHFCFVPVVKERKNKKKLGQEKVCAHDLLTRTYLKTFHKRLQAHLEAQLGCSVGVLLPAEERDLEKNKLTMRELKKQTQEAKSLKKQNQALNAENQNLKDEARELEKNVKQLEEKRKEVEFAPMPAMKFEIPEKQWLERHQAYEQRVNNALRPQVQLIWQKGEAVQAYKKSHDDAWSAYRKIRRELDIKINENNELKKQVNYWKLAYKVASSFLERHNLVQKFRDFWQEFVKQPREQEEMQKLQKRSGNNLER